MNKGIMSERIFVGTDITEVSRIRKSCENSLFVKRVYSQKEIELFSRKRNPYESMAGNWAVKEAFGKCLGTGVRDFSLSEVSCLRDELGRPYLELTGKAGQIATQRGLEFSVSISHTKDYATAVVVAIAKQR
jgi:holo-[acyl-carrier protein] synthase